MTTFTSDQFGGSLSGATVLLYDPQHNIRHQTALALRDIGFKSIVDVAELDEAHKALVAGSFDLVLLAMNEANDGTAEMIRQVRQQRHRHDPFVPIMVSVWRSSRDLVNAAVQGGADDLIKKPYSTAMLARRIGMLVNARKPFVATADYFGPDRRQRADAADDSGTVEAPNSLRDKVQGTPPGSAGRNAAAEALARLQRAKVRNISYQIVALAERAGVVAQADGKPADWTRAMAAIEQAAATYRAALHPSYPASFGSLCDAVARTAGTLRTQAPSARGIAMLEQSALALKTASEISHDDAGTAGEISSALDDAAGAARRYG